MVNAQKWLGEGAKDILSPGSKSLQESFAPSETHPFCTGATPFCTGASPCSLPGLKRPFAPSPNHFRAFTIFGLSPRTFGLQGLEKIASPIFFALPLLLRFGFQNRILDCQNYLLASVPSRHAACTHKSLSVSLVVRPLWPPPPPHRLLTSQMQNAGWCVCGVSLRFLRGQEHGFWQTRSLPENAKRRVQNVRLIQGGCKNLKKESGKGSHTMMFCILPDWHRDLHPPYGVLRLCVGDTCHFRHFRHSQGFEERNPCFCGQSVHS